MTEVRDQRTDSGGGPSGAETPGWLRTRGFVAGVLDKTLDDNPYPADSPQALVWADGWLVKRNPVSREAVSCGKAPPRYWTDSEVAFLAWGESWGMSNPEMGQALRRNAATVRLKRYRLRRKAEKSNTPGSASGAGSRQSNPNTGPDQTASASARGGPVARADRLLPGSLPVTSPGRADGPPGSFS